MTDDATRGGLGMNERIVLARRPQGAMSEECFRLEKAAVSEPGDGEVLVRNRYLSIDPYMRGRMNDAKSYAEPQQIDETMGGGTVGEVVESHDARFSPGDAVLGRLGWQLYGTARGDDLRKIDTRRAPMQAYLGVLGMPGVTAWQGLRICAPKPGDTVVVTSAAGAVGSVAGQLAKAHGCRVVGVAGGPEKVEWCKGELGFDDCIDYRDHDWATRLDAATPLGIDALFENVGGAMTRALVARMNTFGRIAICGLIASYDSGAPSSLDLPPVLVKRLTVRGFIVSDDQASWPAALAEIGDLFAKGKIRYRESVSEGLASAPEALMGLLKGANFGKQLVRLV